MSYPNPASAQIAEPRLLDKRLVPIGPVKIDWTHPSTRELVFFGMPRGNHRGEVDLVNHLPWTERLSWGTFQYFDDGPEGPASYSPLVAKNISSGVDILTSQIIPPDPAQWTLQIAFRIEAWSTSKSFCGINFSGAAGDGMYVGADNAGQRFRWFIYNSGSGSSIDTNINLFDADAWNSAMLTSQGSGNFVEYTRDRATPVTGGPTVGSWATGTNTVVFNNQRPGQAQSINGWIYLISIWHRSLSEGEAKTLQNDPYQFLIPA